MTAPRFKGVLKEASAMTMDELFLYKEYVSQYLQWCDSGEGRKWLRSWMLRISAKHLEELEKRMAVYSV